MYTVRNDPAKRPDNYNIQESCKEVIKSPKCMHILHTLLFTLYSIFIYVGMPLSVASVQRNGKDTS